MAYSEKLAYLRKFSSNLVQLQTFSVPKVVGAEHRELGSQMIKAWQRDGIFQISMDDRQEEIVREAMAVSKEFFRRPYQQKSKFVSDLTYSGYVGSGEETTGGQADSSEIFTISKDLPLDNKFVANGWPCHGPVPWPSEKYEKAVKSLMELNGELGDNLLHLIGMGLNLKNPKSICSLAEDGWHHMRILRFPPKTSLNSVARGIGSHTDYGMLVIAAQDDVGGLWIRPPIEGEERPKNWLPDETTAGMYEEDENWFFVMPIRKTLTVFPGDILQFLTGSQLLSTPHKVALNFRERFAFAYFHEPNFHKRVVPLSASNNDDFIHYGTHFTNMFMRCYPDRITTKRIMSEGRLDRLNTADDEIIDKAWTDKFHSLAKDDRTGLH